MSQPAPFGGCCASGTLIGRNPCDKAFDPFAAEDIALSSKPVGIGVSRLDLRPSPKEAFGGAFEESLDKIIVVIAISTSLQDAYSEDDAAGFPKAL